MKQRPRTQKRDTDLQKFFRGPRTWNIEKINSKLYQWTKMQGKSKHCILPAWNLDAHPETPLPRVPSPPKAEPVEQGRNPTCRTTWQKLPSIVLKTLKQLCSSQHLLRAEHPSPCSRACLLSPVALEDIFCPSLHLLACMGASSVHESWLWRWCVNGMCSTDSTESAG